MAGEANGRRVFAMEISPAYVLHNVLCVFQITDNAKCDAEKGTLVLRGAR